MKTAVAFLKDKFGKELTLYDICKDMTPHDIASYMEEFAEFKLKEANDERANYEKALPIRIVNNCANYKSTDSCRKAKVYGCRGCGYNNEF